MMNEMSDSLLIKRFFEWGALNGLNQAEMANFAKRTRGWVTHLKKERIKSLNFDTRNRLKQILGIQ